MNGYIACGNVSESKQLLQTLQLELVHCDTSLHFPWKIKDARYYKDVFDSVPSPQSRDVQLCTAVHSNYLKHPRNLLKTQESPYNFLLCKGFQGDIHRSCYNRLLHACMAFHDCNSGILKFQNDNDDQNIKLHLLCKQDLDPPFFPYQQGFGEHHGHLFLQGRLSTICAV